MTFRFANIAGRASLVDGDDNWYDLARLTGDRVGPDPTEALADAAALHAADSMLAAAEPDGTMADADIGPPVARPRNVFAIGLNYASHAAESRIELSDHPLVFAKFPSCIVGPHSDIELRCDLGDYEAELVVVIGSGGRDIPADSAWDHVLGLTAGQDVSDRALQFAATPPHFDLGKSRDTFGPTGPVLASVDSFDDPNDLRITCDVNGERRQDGRTSDLIVGVAGLVAYISTVVTLATGDMIFTGTPSGVGVAQGKALAPGDTVVTTIEGIGTLTNRCR